MGNPALLWISSIAAEVILTASCRT
jgi:hypothetical protein